MIHYNIKIVVWQGATYGIVRELFELVRVLLKKIIWSVCFASYLLSPFTVASTNQEAPVEVLASIKPLQLIAQALTVDVSNAEALLPAGVTPHDYALKPSDLERVYSADLLLWMGPDFEPYLAKPAHSRNGAELAVLDQQDHEGHDHDAHHHEGHEHLYGDPHVWFGPEEAQHIAEALLTLLVEQDEKNARQYQQNLDDFLLRLKGVDKHIKNQLANGTSNYLVAHDAYSHFEKHYGLSHSGVVSLQPETKPGAKGLLKLRKLIASEQVKCLFVEPQTDPRIVNILVEGNNLQVYSLDPMATAIDVSANGYEQFLLDTANRFAQCR